MFAKLGKTETVTQDPSRPEFRSEMCPTEPARHEIGESAVVRIWELGGTRRCELDTGKNVGQFVEMEDEYSLDVAKGRIGERRVSEA